jgi:hypothetical protein
MRGFRVQTPESPVFEFLEKPSSADEVLDSERFGFSNPVVSLDPLEIGFTDPFKA